MSRTPRTDAAVIAEAQGIRGALAATSSELERELAGALEAAREANDPYARAKRLALIDELAAAAAPTGRPR